MRRTRKTSENETETKPIRRTRQTSVITDSPVRRSARNKQQSSMQSVDILAEDTPRPTRNLRSRKKVSESEIPPSPIPPKRKTRTNSVADVIPKNRNTIPLKGRKRLTVPVESSLIDEDKSDNETSLESPTDETDHSSKETSMQNKSDQSDQNSSKEDEIDDSHVATGEDSIIFVDEIRGVKSVVKKKEMVQTMQKNLMKRLISNKLNFSNNDESVLEMKKEDSIIDSDEHKEKTPERREKSFKKSAVETPEKIKIVKRKSTPYPMNELKVLKKRVSELSNFKNEDNDKNDGEENYYEPMEVDTSYTANNSNRNLNLESEEKIVVPERIKLDFKPRNSMIEMTSEKHLISKSRYSLGSKKPEFVNNEIISKYQEKKNKKSLSTENSEPDGNDFQVPSVSGEKRFSTENRKSLDNSSKKTPKSSPLHLLVTPDKEEFLKSNKAEIIKSTEKISRKRKRISSDSESSFNLSMCKYDSSLDERNQNDSSLLKGNLAKENNDDSSTKRKSSSRKSFDSKKATNSEEEKTPINVEKINFSGDSRQDEIFTFTGKETTPKAKNRKSESFEEGEISDSDEEEQKENSKLSNFEEEGNSNFFANILKKKSKSKSLGGLEIASKSSTRNCKSLDKISLNAESKTEKKSETKTKSEISLKNSTNETDSDSSVSVENANKPKIKNIEILPENDSLISRLKLNREKKTSEETSTEEESSDEEEMETVKIVLKKESTGKTATPKKKLEELESNVNRDKKLNLSGKLDEDSEDSVSRIPTFMFSQTSESEETCEDASRSIDSDIAREYNLGGKNITHYSDDDVPGDDCRDSESEHSDPDDDGSDLDDFINDDEVETEDSETEHYEESEDRDKEKETQKVIVVDEEETDDNKDEDNGDDNKEDDDNESDDSVFEVDLKSSLEVHKSKMKRKGKQNEIESQIEKETNIQLEKNEPDRRKSKSKSEIQNAEKDETCSDVVEISSEEKFPSSNSPVVSKSRSDKSLEEQNHETLKESPELEQLISETKQKKKSKRKLKSTAAKVPVASSTHYELSDSDEEPQSLSFAEALVNVADDMKKKAESIKKGIKMKEKRKQKKEHEENATGSDKVKRLPDEILQELEDVPRPKKRQKIIHKENLETQPCPGCSYNSENATSVSSFGSTTEFDVVNLKKEKKPKTQSNLAMQWFKQRMLARNPRQPISTYLSQQRKKRAANKDRLPN